MPAFADTEADEHVQPMPGEGPASDRIAEHIGGSRIYNGDPTSAYVKIGREYLPIKEVVECMKHVPAATAIMSEPSMEALEHKILIRMPEYPTFAPPNFVAKLYPSYFRSVCKEHHINPRWGEFEPRRNRRRNRSPNYSRVLIEEDGRLIEADAVELPKDKSILETYDAEKIFYEGDAGFGNKVGTFTALI